MVQAAGGSGGSKDAQLAELARQRELQREEQRKQAAEAAKEAAKKQAAKPQTKPLEKDTAELNKAATDGAGADKVAHALKDAKAGNAADFDKAFGDFHSADGKEVVPAPDQNDKTDKSKGDGKLGGVFGGIGKFSDPNKDTIDHAKIDPHVPTHPVPDRQDEEQTAARKGDYKTVNDAETALKQIPADDPKHAEYEQKVKDLHNAFAQKWGAEPSIPDPVQDGKDFKLATPDGKIVNARIDKDHGDKGLDLGLFHIGGHDPDPTKSTLTINGVKTELHVDKGVDYHEKVDTIAKTLADLPQDMQKSIHKIDVHEGADPDDKDYQKQFNDPNFHVGATGGGGTIDFYNNSVDEGTLIHEGAHNYADDKFGNVDPRQTSNGNADGKAWDAAVNKDADVAKQQGRDDGGYPSDYGKYVRDRTDSDGEDFAEATRVYMQAKEQGPQALDDFRKKYPNRAKILDDLYANAA